MQANCGKSELWLKAWTSVQSGHQWVRYETQSILLYHYAQRVRYNQKYCEVFYY